MKRPRRPVKRKAVKRAKPIKRSTLEITAIQAEVFEIPKPPAQLAYQWAPADSLLDMQDAGWLAVPFERHKSELSARKFNRDGFIVAFDQMLFQREAVLVRADRDLAHRKAKENLQGHDAYQDPDHFRRGQVGFFKILSPSFMVSSAYEHVPVDAPPIDIDLTVKFRVSPRWQDAAAAIGLDITEYARRRLLMEPSVIATGDDRVFEFVELSISRKD